MNDELENSAMKRLRRNVSLEVFRKNTDKLRADIIPSAIRTKLLQERNLECYSSAMFLRFHSVTFMEHTFLLGVIYNEHLSDSQNNKMLHRPAQLSNRLLGFTSWPSTWLVTASSP
jgi:hypothetical protein